MFLHLEAQLPEPQSSIEVGQLTCDDERFILVDTIIKEDYKFKQFFDVQTLLNKLANPKPNMIDNIIFPISVVNNLLKSILYYNNTYFHYP